MKTIGDYTFGFAPITHPTYTDAIVVYDRNAEEPFQFNFSVYESAISNRGFTSCGLSLDEAIDSLPKEVASQVWSLYRGRRHDREIGFAVHSYSSLVDLTFLPGKKGTIVTLRSGRLSLCSTEMDRFDLSGLSAQLTPELRQSISHMTEHCMSKLTFGFLCSHPDARIEVSGSRIRDRDHRVARAYVLLTGPDVSCLYYAGLMDDESISMSDGASFDWLPYPFKRAVMSAFEQLSEYVVTYDQLMQRVHAVNVRAGLR